ncbi:VOC family protein [Streptomyces sp. NPDC054813]
MRQDAEDSAVGEGVAAACRCAGPSAGLWSHPDLITSDYEGERGRLLALGATKLHEVVRGGARWTTFADVEGNEFDLIAG